MGETDGGTEENVKSEMDDGTKNHDTLFYRGVFFKLNHWSN